ncbi:hypothetical protein [Paraburkholderia caribensis]|uniref:hypothetical protein n=1 Tax=Paraburkholderia caribensis TaxID=75105 RepID=UPI0020919BCC|nr:hypothetical protein [Paraburkholderia caribensis]MCO4880246.1 hypothetical protein [Paraburkholderia caribensis]
MARKKTYREVVIGAMRDLLTKGVTNTSLARCMAELRRAFPDSSYLENAAEDTLTRIYESSKKQAAIQYLKIHQQQIEDDPEANVPAFTRRDLDKRAREILDRKIMETVNLIKLRREKEMNLSLQRFSGWATSLGDSGPTTVIKARKVKVGESSYVRNGKLVSRPVFEMKMTRVPVNGTEGVGQVQLELFSVAKRITEPSQKIQYEQRRVTNDQGHKLAANIGEAVAESQKAIGYVWNHHFSKNPRADHEDLDGRVFLYRDSWAAQQGLVKPPDGQWAEDLETKPALEINCRCTSSYIYTLPALFRKFPDCLTEKGRATLGK